MAGAKIEKLVCDRCGLELTGEDGIELALEGSKTWEGAVRARGLAPRGIYPCKNYVRCGGEMLIVVRSRRQRLIKLFRR